MSMTMSERLDHARAALTAYFEAKGEALPGGPWDYEDTDASDLIADLLHLQKLLGLRGTGQTIQTAMLHFEAEEEERSSEPDMDGHYTVRSSHGQLTADTEGLVISRDLANNEPDGGGHLAHIIRFDLEEWRKHWNSPTATEIDILDLGYWYTEPATGQEAYTPPDATWRAEIAEVLMEREIAGAKLGCNAVRLAEAMQAGEIATMAECLKDILSRFRSCIAQGNGEIGGDKEAIHRAEAALASAGDGTPSAR